MTLDEKISVMQAFERGEEIEISWISCGTIWETVNHPSWNWSMYLYRIKPKSKQTVTIEKWLCETDGRYEVRESSNIEAYVNGYWKVVKLIDTYEVEL